MISNLGPLGLERRSDMTSEKVAPIADGQCATERRRSQLKAPCFAQRTRLPWDSMNIASWRYVRIFGDLICRFSNCRIRGKPNATAAVARHWNYGISPDTELDEGAKSGLHDRRPKPHPTAPSDIC